jgi:hypothetical protein
MKEKERPAGPAKPEPRTRARSREARGQVTQRSHAAFSFSFFFFFFSHCRGGRSYLQPLARVYLTYAYEPEPKISCFFAGSVRFRALFFHEILSINNPHLCTLYPAKTLTNPAARLTILLAGVRLCRRRISLDSDEYSRFFCPRLVPI